MSPPGRNNPTLELKIISAKDVSHDLLAKMEVYAVVSITGDNTQRKQVAKTPIDFNGGSNPKWNHTVKFSVNEKAAREGQLTLSIKLLSHWLEEENDLYLGEVNIWVHELIDSSDFPPLTNDNGDKSKSATYRVKNKEEINGTLTLSYRFKPVQVADLYPPVSPPLNPQSVYQNPNPTISGQPFIYPPQFQTIKKKLALELVIKFAENIRNVNILNEMNVYASVMIRDENNITQSKTNTPTVYSANKSPMWNHAVTFSVEEKLVRDGRLTLVVELISLRPVLGDTTIGEVKVSIQELVGLSPPSPLVNGDDNGMTLVTRNVTGSYGKRGKLSFMYRFKFTEEPVAVARPVIMYVPVPDHGTLGYMTHPGFQAGPSSGMQPIYIQPPVQPHGYQIYSQQQMQPLLQPQPTQQVQPQQPLMQAQAERPTLYESRRYQEYVVPPQQVRKPAQSQGQRESGGQMVQPQASGLGAVGVGAGILGRVIMGGGLISEDEMNTDELGMYVF